MYTSSLDSFVAFLEVVCALFVPVFLYEEVSELRRVWIVDHGFEVRLASRIL